MSSRLIVVGNASSNVAGQVFEELVDALESHLRGQNVGEILAAPEGGATVVRDPEAALRRAVVSARSDQNAALVVAGLASSPAPSFDVLGWNLEVAAGAGLAVVYALDAGGMGADLIETEIKSFLKKAAAHHATVAGVVLLGARAVRLDTIPVAVLHSPLTEADAQTLAESGSSALTPMAFQMSLLDRAAENPMRIVLPEPEDERILEAAGALLAQGVARLILIGDPQKVAADAASLGLDLSQAKVISASDPELADKYAQELARIRASKGMTLDQARAIVADPTYFATMMVQMGDADGMVSGATHTTADTIRPAFQIIKTAPGTKLVSSAFIMLLADRPVLFADCAVVVSPDAEALAQIAESTAKTASAFGIDPKVAMLSYSTKGSGSGPSVDVVTEATALAQQADPKLAIDGPLQFDAAFDAGTAAKKAPGSAVAGKANVFVFPDLNAGNIAYKAVQRSAGAVAVGPILQGLRKPVNDLSRGATVEDIVNTVAITAVQAQAEGTN